MLLFIGERVSGKEVLMLGSAAFCVLRLAGETYLLSYGNSIAAFCDASDGDGTWNYRSSRGWLLRSRLPGLVTTIFCDPCPRCMSTLGPASSSFEVPECCSDS